ncbi:MAG: hypothetical protein ACRDHZ_06650 [Ktedonobacteraceae bacterium]
MPAVLPLGAFFVAKSVFIPTLSGSYFLLIAAQGFFNIRPCWLEGSEKVAF